MFWRPNRGPEATTLEDFESGNLNNWTGDTGDYDVQSSVALEGAQSVETQSVAGSITYDGETTTRDGRVYRLTERNDSNDDESVGLLMNAQSTGSTAVDDCYWIRAEVSSDELQVFKRSGGGTSVSWSSAVSLSSGTVYKYRTTLTDSSSFDVSILDEQDSELLSMTIQDGEYSAGSVGLWTDKSGNYADELIKEP